MRVFVFSVLASMIAGGAYAQSAPCDRTMPQIDLNQCAADAWRVQDAELNRLWGIVKPAADARGQGQALLQAQRAWLGYRDSTCDAEAAQYAGGSIRPLVHADCLHRLTVQRNAELRGMIR